MTSPISQIAGVTLSSEVRRPRTTPKPTQAFQEVLRTGAQVLLAGASAASGLVGGPLLSSAIDAARAGLAQASGSSGGGSGGTTLLSGTTSGAGGATVGAGLGGLPGTAGGTAGGAAGGAAGGTAGSATSELEAMRQIQREGQQHNMQYLQLQQEAQDENRRYSMASNLLKAQHDTARSAINNLRV